MRPHDHLASAGNDVIVIDLGLRPEEPMMDWDKGKSSVTNKAGETIGFVDMNDGLRIHVYLRPIDGAAQVRGGVAGRD